MSLDDRIEQLEEDHRQLEQWYHQQELEHQRWLNQIPTKNGGPITTKQQSNYTEEVI